MSQVMHPNTQCYVGNVPFDKNYKNVLKFNSASEQFNSIISEIKSHNYKEFEEMNVIKPDESYVKLKGNYHEFQFFNYIVFRNTRYDYGHVLSQKWYFAFIDSVEWISSETTKINYTLDIWQTFHLTLKLLPSFVKRMHVATSEDSFRRWQAPEPFSLNFNRETILLDTTTNTDWERRWVLEATSKPEGSGASKHFDYEGTGNGQNYYGLYGWGFTSESGTASGVKRIVDTFKPADDVTITLTDFTLEDVTDHRKDIVGIHQVPAFALANVGHANQLTSNVLTSSNLGSVTFSNSALANGYTPKNKKLFGSLCRAGLIFNKNGVRKSIDPFKITAYTISLLAQTKPMGTSSVIVTVGGYTADENTMAIPYYSATPICFNQNIGITQDLNIMKAQASALSFGMNLGVSAGNLKAEGASAGEAGQAIGGSLLGGLVDTVFTNPILANADVTGTTGNSGDSLTTTPAYIGLKVAEINPEASQCKMVDDYLSTYGYAINEIIQPSITNRSNWNYIEMAQPNFEILANADVKDKFYKMFEAGITVWHSMAGFLDYSQNNT